MEKQCFKAHICVLPVLVTKPTIMGSVSLEQLEYCKKGETTDQKKGSGRSNEWAWL